jgi:hypothetical protein
MQQYAELHPLATKETKLDEFPVAVNHHTIHAHL